MGILSGVPLPARPYSGEHRLGSGRVRFCLGRGAIFYRQAFGSHRTPKTHSMGHVDMRCRCRHDVHGERCTLVVGISGDLRIRHGHALSQSQRGGGGYRHPNWRGTAIGIYRFWRDLGYGIGALALGLVANVSAGLSAGFWFVTVAMLASGAMVAWWGEETHPRLNPAAT